MTALSEAQIEQIRTAAEQLLEKTGFCVMDKGIQSRARAVGATVDEAGNTVRLPASLLRELLAKAPSNYTIAGLDGQQAVVGGDNRCCHAIVTDPWIVDYETQQPRRPRLEDMRRHTIIAQKLDIVKGVSCMDFPVTDVDGPTSNLRALEEHLVNCGKHYLVYVASPEGYKRWTDIGRIVSRASGVAEGKLMTLAVAVRSPLTLTEFNAELLMNACAHNVPVIPTICPMAGTTSPYSLGSTLLLGHAENLFVAALTQLINPGNPFLYACGPSVSDLRSGHDLYYTIDKVLWKIAHAQLARSYNLPCTAECGGTLTYRYDQQNGAEGMLFMLSAYNSKANLLCGIGSCYNALGMSAEMMIIHTAWLEAVKFLADGINTDEFHLGLGSLEEAGHGANFLIDDLTLDHMRGGEFFSNGIFDFSGGSEDGPSLLSKAHDQVEAMFENYVSPVPGEIQEDLRRYFHSENATVSA